MEILEWIFILPQMYILFICVKYIIIQYKDIRVYENNPMYVYDNKSKSYIRNEKKINTYQKIKLLLKQL